VARNAARQRLLIAVRHVFLYDVKRNLAANEAHFGTCRNMLGHFLCGVESVKRYVTPFALYRQQPEMGKQNVDFADQWKNFC